jgi:hypothetical protein
MRSVKLSSGEAGRERTFGHRLATPVTTPVAPTDMPGTSQSLWPVMAKNWVGSNSARMRETFAMPPQVSLQPTMLGCLPRRENMSELTSRPATTPGKL